jgi:hypothetical protein
MLRRTRKEVRQNEYNLVIAFYYMLYMLISQVSSNDEYEKSKDDVKKQQTSITSHQKRKRGFANGGVKR